MSATTITKNCAINIDHSLGQSAGEISACWVYFKDKNNQLVGGEGSAFVYTQKKELIHLCRVVLFGGATETRHLENLKIISGLLNSHVKMKIKQAIVADLIRNKMLG